MKPLLTQVHIATYTDDCVNLYHPDTGVKTIDEFVHRVGKLSKKYLGIKAEDEEDNENYKDPSNAFKGAMLEVLSEVFFGAFYTDPAVGVRDYQPVPLTEDYGVDAIGINVIGTLVAIQCKFRSDPSAAISYTDLAKTYTAGRIRHHLPLDVDDSLILFTTCNSVSKACKQVFGSQLRCITKNIIGQRINGNETFWMDAEQRIAATLHLLQNPSG